MSLIAVATLLGACSGEDGADYCKNHYLFHPDHLDSIAALTIELSDNGDLSGHLTIPRVVVGSLPEANVKQLLGDPARSFTLQSATACALSLTGISVTADSYDANYAANCGLDNQIGKIDVALFDQLIDLDEIVVAVTTPATGKRFSISRQCDRPIFRLKKR